MLDGTSQQLKAIHLDPGLDPGSGDEGTIIEQTDPFYPGGPNWLITFDQFEDLWIVPEDLLIQLEETL